MRSVSYDAECFMIADGNAIADGKGSPRSAGPSLLQPGVLR